ncbi:replication initiator [Streptomyces mobaraensis]|uniref:replication initiator n=1 Tax=Streptomyces mobaraensis TaxID=35621 RepID=UPI00340F13AD
MARLRRLPLIDQEIIHLANTPGFTRWLEQVTATGGCARPVHLTGHATTVDAATGEILHHYDTRDEPGERLLVRCRNRRHTVCEPCSRLHAGDTYHLVRSGLTGGKTIPATVTTHPLLFVTLTAPGFGPVHRTTTDGTRCRPRRGTPHCEHGRPLGCSRTHLPDAPAVGQPLCPDCYDYTGHVLWHALAGELWSRFTRTLRRSLAATAGIPQSRFHDHARLSFAKVAEYQRRAAVHVHAVIRLDGPAGPGTQPPAWATTTLLTDAVRTVASRTTVRTPYSPALGEHTLRWGTQLDVRPLDTGDLADDAVAGYIAKYVTKSVTETNTGTDHPIRTHHDIAATPATPHVRTLMHTCWRLGGLPELRPLRLRAWTHTLGYRGHILTKSRVYSTTYAALRAARTKHRQAPSGAPVMLRTKSESTWRFVGTGHTPGGALLAMGIAVDVAVNRQLARANTKVGGEGP